VARVAVTDHGPGLSAANRSICGSCSIESLASSSRVDRARGWASACIFARQSLRDTGGRSASTAVWAKARRSGSRCLRL
jgi:hypothetical protein